MKEFAFLAAFISVILVSGCVSDSGQPPGTNGDGQDTNGDGQVLDKITMAEVADHASAQDCWMILDEKVYDFTSYIAGANHPGGAAILEGCGGDGTDLFETRPMGSGTPHSGGARSLHDPFLIGELEGV
jgi:hypothetical protein